MAKEAGHSCPKCDEAMEIGWVIDSTIGGIEKRVSHWKRGMPEHEPPLARYKQGDEEALPIIAYRCVQCGYLEYYAWPMDWPEVT